MNGWEQIRFHVDDPTASSWLLLSFLPPLQFTPPTTRAYCYCALAELQSIIGDATPVASNRIAGETTATTTDKVREVENILRGLRSLQVHVLLENVLLKLSQFQTKRKSSQQAGTPGAMKGDKPLYFLTEMCEVHELNKTGTKETQAKRLVEHYFKHPDDVPDYLQDMIPNGEWKKAAQKDRHVVEVVDTVVDSLEDENDDDLGSVDSDSEDMRPPKGTLGIREFPNEMLATCFFAKKRCVYPKSKTFWFCNHEFTTSFVDDALAMVNTTPWNQQPIVQHQEVLCRRMAMCPL
jgi:hypothetical protein